MIHDGVVARRFRGEGLDDGAPKTPASEEAGYSRLAMEPGCNQSHIIS